MNYQHDELCESQAVDIGIGELHGPCGCAEREIERLTAEVKELRKKAELERELIQVTAELEKAREQTKKDHFSIDGLLSEIREWMKRIELAEAKNAELIAENTCDVCAGIGKPISGLLCMCGGSGKMSDAAVNLRKNLYTAEARIKELEAKLQEKETIIQGAK